MKAGEAVLGDDYFGSKQLRVEGKTDLYVPIRYNHRMAWVKASDVEEAAPVAPVSGANRYNVVARDSGVAIAARRTGIVDQVDAMRIVVRATEDVGPNRPAVVAIPG